MSKPKKMYYFIVNLTSRTGKTRKIWIKIQQELKKKNVSYEAYVTEFEGHAKILAEKLCTKGIRHMEKNQGESACLVVVGGDGTVNEVVNGMHHFEQITFGYIAAGSGNDLGRGLGIAKDPIEALCNILNAKEPYAMDLGCVSFGKTETSCPMETNYFTISSGIGLDADVCKLTLASQLKIWLNRLHLGSLTYLLLTIKALFTMPTTEVEAIFDHSKKRKLKKMIFIAGMNHRCEGGGIPMVPMADDRDGKISVCCAHGIPRWKTFFLLPVLVMGKHTGLKGFEVFDCTTYELWLKQPMALHADGECYGEQTYMKFTCLPGKLQVMK